MKRKCLNSNIILYNKDIKLTLFYLVLANITVDILQYLAGKFNIVLYYIK